MEGMAGVESFQLPFVQSAATIGDWKLQQPGTIGLLDVIRNAKPTALIGVSGQFGAFDQAVVEAMCAQNNRPIIFPLSNPTSKAEATPQDIDRWSAGRALVGTGSPFPAIVRNGIARKVDQTNNSYIFPGVGLGAVAVQARRVTAGMMMAAAKALASISPALKDPSQTLLPPVAELRAVSKAVALAVAGQALEEGLTSGISAADIEVLVGRSMWAPSYASLPNASGTLESSRG
jgi:malate dehydrogenase (oxaloacetate-decarboxylating)